MPERAPDSPADRFALAGRGLREQTARGTLINAVFLIGFNALGLLKGFVVAALLSASDYGVWAIIVIGLGTLGWLKQVGIGDKYVQQAEADQELAFQRAFTLELITTAAYGVVVAAVIPVLALVYGEPKLIAPAAFTLLLLPAAILQAAIWVHYRRMAFVRQRALEAIDPIITFAVTVALAVAGAGYWSLVIGAVCGAWAAAAGAVWHSPYPLRLRYDRGTLRSYAGFSWPLLLAGAAGSSPPRDRCSPATTCSASPGWVPSRWRARSSCTPIGSTRSSPPRSTPRSAPCATGAISCSSPSSSPTAWP